MSVADIKTEPESLSNETAVFVDEAKKETFFESNVKQGANGEIYVSFRCKQDNCINEYSTLAKLNRHIVNDHRGKKCDQCEKKFRSYSTLKNHKIRFHNYKQVCLSETYGYKTENWSKRVDKEIKVNVTKNLKTYSRTAKPKVVPQIKEEVAQIKLEIKEEPELILPD